MKKVLMSLILLFSTFFASPSQSTTLPDEVIKWFKTGYKVENIRFDGVIELQTGQKYLPIILLSQSASGTQDLTVNLIGKDLKYPELIVFGNSYAFFKLIEMNHKETVWAEDVPINIKLGLLPQDFIVPQNFYIPKELVGVLGDLNIPIFNPENIAIKSTTPPTTTTITQQTSLPVTTSSPVPEENKDKKNDTVQHTVDKDISPVEKTFQSKPLAEENSSSFVATPLHKFLFAISNNIEAITVVDFDNTKNLLNYLKVGILPYALEISTKYLFVVSHKENKLDVFDLNTLAYIKSITTGDKPTQAVLSPSQDKIFVGNQGSNTLSIIDAEKLELLENIEMPFTPDIIWPLSDGSGVFISYTYSGILNRIEWANPKNIMFLGKIKGLTDFVANKNNTAIFALSRQFNSIVCLEIKFNQAKKRYEGVVLHDTEFGKKPVKLLLSDDEEIIYVLCAGDDSLYLIHAGDLSVLKKIPLNTGGFPTDMTKTKNNKIIISNSEKPIVSIVDIITGEVVTLPTGTISKKITTTVKYGKL